MTIKKKDRNENDTENFVRKQFEDAGYYLETNDIQVQEKKSHIELVRTLLKNAGKRGNGGAGYPEFIVSSLKHNDFLVVVECKADPKDHASDQQDSLLKGAPIDETPDQRGERIAGHAVDGALHYASCLSSEYNVIALAVSGQTPLEMKIDTYLHSKGSARPIQLKTKGMSPAEIHTILPWDEYIEHATFDPQIQRLRHEELMSFSKRLHEFMRDHAKLSESEKPLLVSGTLLALRNKAFSASYANYPAKDLQAYWKSAIDQECASVGIPSTKKLNMSMPYTVLANHPELGELPSSDPRTKSYPNGIMHELIKMLAEKVYPFISHYQNFDVVGQFYGEFLKYTGGDKKALGIVLTPRHITELFSELANVTADSKVLDPCAGTGTFLISAMQRMMRFATNEDQRLCIKEHQLIGIEQQPHMFALAASNMILRGDGRANLHLGSCFDDAISKSVREQGAVGKVVGAVARSERSTAMEAKKCDVGFINPPYSQGDKDLHELKFVQHMLSMLEKGGTAVAIVPISCAISQHPIRAELLKEHTLEAVMSMPDDLFNSVGTVTCLMVFTAHKPHALTAKDTWFGIWKNDGHVKTKHLGRVDVHRRWESTRAKWVDMFRNRKIVPGISVSKAVTADDEWCAEAYIATNYSTVPSDLFGNAITNFLAFKMTQPTAAAVAPLAPIKDGWVKFTVDQLFDIKKGRRLTKLMMKPGKTPFVGAIDSNNGIREYIDAKPIHQGGTITVNYNGSVGEAFYQPEPFWASDDVNVLYPRSFQLNALTGMFFATLLRLEKFRFSYGRKWHLPRMKSSELYLPVDASGKPDLPAIEAFMKTLPFGESATLAEPPKTAQISALDASVDDGAPGESDEAQEGTSLGDYSAEASRHTSAPGEAVSGTRMEGPPKEHMDDIILAGVDDTGQKIFTGLGGRSPKR